METGDAMKLLVRSLQVFIVLLCVALGVLLFFKAWDNNSPEAPLMRWMMFIIGLLVDVSITGAIGLAIAEWIGRIIEPPNTN